MDSFTITVPLPGRILSPNVRSHWRPVSKAKRVYRKIAYVMCIRELNVHRSPAPLWDEATVHCDFYFKTMNFPDPDNCIASMKAAFDGIADAGIVFNDRKLWPDRPTMQKDAENPRVEITITPAIKN
jgi:hypothetical protein